MAMMGMYGVILLYGKTIAVTPHLSYSIEEHIQPIYTIGKFTASSFEPTLERTVTVLLESLHVLDKHLYNKMKKTHCPVDIIIHDKKDGKIDLVIGNCYLQSGSIQRDQTGRQIETLSFVGTPGKDKLNGLDRAIQRVSLKDVET